MTALKLAATSHREGESGGLFFLDETDVSGTALDPRVLATLTPAVTSTTGAHEIVTISNPKRPRGWRARLQAAQRALREVAETLREACAWLTGGITDDLRRRRHRGSHRVAPPAGVHRLLPTQRSREPRDSEVSLAICDTDPVALWVAAAAEASRRLAEARRGPARADWHCS